MVNGNQVCAGGEGTLNLEFDESCNDGGEDMTAAEHGLSDGHQIGNGVVTITNKL